MPDNFNIHTVLVAPLDWGLGHATRCIPIIRALVTNGFNVIIAADGAQAHLLNQEFPMLTILPIPGYRVRYAGTRAGLALALMKQLPRLKRLISEEHQWLQQVIDQHQINLVISDNRYGLYSEKVSCIFITHQLIIKAPFGWLQKILQYINYRYINRFSACWVPDTEGEHNLAGILSHPEQLPAIPVRYMGVLSRFREKKLGKKYDYCILLSGPEPQRSLLEEKIIQGLPKLNSTCLLVRGKPGEAETIFIDEKVTVKNHLRGSELEEAINQSDYIVCRSGYTSVMELLSLHKKAILIPTPGQTEQEYLAERLQEKGYCLSFSQDRFDCSKHLPMAETFSYQQVSLITFGETDLPPLLNSSLLQ
ncbi:MAG: glycosyltransferase [Bacteroidetes bacterium]|nr:glycosyltransferase [Bacteroidota bacterium]